MLSLVRGKCQEMSATAIGTAHESLFKTVLIGFGDTLGARVDPAEAGWYNGW